jgi:hypothetical protein
MLCFAAKNVLWKMDGEALPRGGSGTRSARVGSFSEQPGSAGCHFKLRFAQLDFQNLTEV